MKSVWVIFFSLLVCTVSKGQMHLALPPINNYHSIDYKAGVQNWAVGEGRSGVMYFGNSEGLLTFDGHFWKRYQLPNQTVIRSLKISDDGRIYVGGQSEIGYFFPDAEGRLIYHSLNQLLAPADRKFADIWNIVLLKDQVLFRTRDKIIHLKDGAIRIYRPQTKWEFLGEVHQQLYAQEYHKGLVRYDNGVWQPVCQDTVLNETAVTAILPYGKDTLLLATLKKGLFLLHHNTLTPKKTAADVLLSHDRLYSVLQIDPSRLALGTNAAGVLCIDREGRIVQRYSNQEGMQKNNVRSLFLDQRRNLWVGLDDGIDQVLLNSAIRYIYPDKQQITGYTSRIFQQRLYIGTSNGLYVAPVDVSKGDLGKMDGAFTEVANTTGQVWNLDEINNQLLVGHEDGSLQVNGNSALRLYNTTGTWLFRPTSQVFPASRILAGTYTGLRLLQFEGGRFLDKGVIEGLPESLRFLALDDHEPVIWASHPNRGIYRIRLSADYTKIEQTQLLGKQDGLPADNGNYIFRIKNRIVAATIDGVYEYSGATHKFAPSASLSPAFKGIRLQYLHEDGGGNIWFLTERKIGVIDYEHVEGKERFRRIWFPELQGRVLAGYESIYSWNEENILLAANKGIIHLNYKQYLLQTRPPQVFLGQVKVSGERDSTLFDGYAVDDGKVVPFHKLADVVRLKAGMNALHFEFSSTLPEQALRTEFSYRLEGFDPEWSGWTSKTEKDYTNLSPGRYTFRVRARNNLGEVSGPVSYAFVIGRAWYNSYWMYAFYFCLLCVAIYIVLQWQQRKHEAAQLQLQYLHQLEMDRAEKELVELKNQKLETDINFKNRELLTMTINLVQRGEVLTRIREMVTGLMKKDVIGDNTPAFKNLLKLIREVEKSNEDWDQFAIHFNNVNADFFNTLRAAYPELTANDLKLCAYLRMNLSTKEIAQLLNITIKAVEIARYRLRKKLQLMPDTNLADFLTHLPKNHPSVAK
ncbi:MULTISPECIES: triple tyrosine motif-containing protein [Chitinophaga]|uniref:triple tyrosine motif-containing protein n=1 Tax=Chitinophaga TaxID=79328 RepID=UPI000BAEFD49|nr:MULTISPECIES: triple tyrosine motif-containing protein [Chitinophaga]ASZ14377.1 transcriptional regulator [Chitinophaga sp. MD30]